MGYGKNAVLAGVDAGIEAGSFVGILGHNGSGKTTLLRTLLGLIPPLKGQLVRRGAGLGLVRFGYVPQKERLDPLYPLSAFDVVAMGTYRNVELFQRLRGLGRRGFVQDCLAAAGAQTLADKLYSDLSGGQKQRVLIARALAAEPEVLALDEPLAGIDVTTQKALLKLLGELKQDRGLTILMVSHRIRAEKGLFTHILWCNDGKAAMGTTEEMLTGELKEIFHGEAG
ncbi:MAG: ATP-binding cassette domain-containing protein [Elusimicrobia bacterium]|nr:ATP-binding cassette domain-containing protein [Elusimicrobiota bacterium]